MCLQPTSVSSIQRYHWGGDEIVHEPIIPASRTIARTRQRSYPIDIREYLSTESNAVIRAHLRALVKGLGPAEQALFGSGAAGSFDFRMQAVCDYVSQQLRYQKTGRGFDEWRFPDETLAAGGGDCEDLAFALAALLEASGISAYCLRVALGSFTQRTTRIELAGAPGKATPKVTFRPEKQADHAWVVYLNESGAWQILEPLALSQQGAESAAPAAASQRQPARAQRQSGKGAPAAFETVDAEYLPHFVFNRHHLWRVRTREDDSLRPLPKYLEQRNFWAGFKPSYATSIHNSIYDEALTGMSAADLATVHRVSLGVDVNVLAYDPRDHFDFSYLPEGWQRVQRRLASKKLTDFGLAVHAIADFYAHSLYGEFAPQRADWSIAPYNPEEPLEPERLVYDFSKYAPLPGCSDGAASAAAAWRGKLISGQWWRWFTTFPRELKTPANFAHRRCLPDHDTIAVDTPRPSSAHRRYDEAEYALQFALRRGAAVEHIRAAYRAWRG